MATIHSGAVEASELHVATAVIKVEGDVADYWVLASHTNSNFILGVGNVDVAGYCAFNHPNLHKGIEVPLVDIEYRVLASRHQVKLGDGQFDHLRHCLAPSYHVFQCGCRTLSHHSARQPYSIVHQRQVVSLQAEETTRLKHHCRFVPIRRIVSAPLIISGRWAILMRVMLRCLRQLLTSLSFSTSRCAVPSSRKRIFGCR